MTRIEFSSPSSRQVLAMPTQNRPPSHVRFFRLISALVGCLRTALAEAFHWRGRRRAAYSDHATWLALGQYDKTKLLAATEKKSFA